MTGEDAFALDLKLVVLAGEDGDGEAFGGDGEDALVAVAFGGGYYEAREPAGPLLNALRYRLERGVLNRFGATLSAPPQCE